MSKRRGVVISTNQAPSIAKSKSANINPQLYQAQSHPLAYQIEPAMYQSGEIEPMADEQMIESNFISEQPPREVNLMHYAYHDPDNPYDTIENKYEENEEDVIVSMHKKKEMIQAMKKEENIKKIQAKKKTGNLAPSREKRANRNKQPQGPALARVVQNTSQGYKKYKPKSAASRQKGTRQNRRQQQADHTDYQPIPRPSIDHQKLKPRPLDFTVDMFDRKAMYSPHKRRRDDLYGNYRAIGRGETENISQQPFARYNIASESEAASGVNENINSRKLPFRLCAFS